VYGKFSIPAFQAVDASGTLATGVEGFRNCGTHSRSQHSIRMGSEFHLFSRLFKTLAETLSFPFDSVLLDGFNRHGNDTELNSMSDCALNTTEDRNVSGSPLQSVGIYDSGSLR
jgi:hypothetical protein